MKNTNSSIRKNRAAVALALVLLIVVAAGAYRTFIAIAELIRRSGLSGEAVRNELIEAAGMLAAYVLAALLAVLAVLQRLRRVTSRLVRTEQRLDAMRCAAEQAQGMITFFDRRGRIRYANPAVEAVTGYSRRELVGKRGAKWLPWYGKRLKQLLQKEAHPEKPFRAVLQATTKTGDPLYLDENITSLPGPDGSTARFVSTAVDITRQKRLEDSVERLGRYDAVTDLPNRLYFSAMFEQAVLAARSEGGRLSVLLIDIDRFKRINDLFGLETGDALLRQIAVRLRDAVGRRDIVARLGSNEFAVIHVQETDLPAMAVAENIRSALAEPIAAGGQELVVTVTTGIATFPDNGADARDLLRNADLALSKARMQGRNAILAYEEGIGAGLSEFFQLEKKLFSALRNREYLVHYQPCFDLFTKDCLSAEALIAWNSPELGDVPPSRFIPSLENTGMIIDVGKWVLETACGQIREWQTRKRALPVSVNLSFAQFRHKDLVRMVSETVDGFKLDPRNLTLEVTESVFMHDMDGAVGILKRLKDVGVSLSIDDFGTGYSSLSYLKKLPVDIVKIDMSFVREVTRDQDAASIVSAITTLARGLNLKTIAEGVETEEQRNILHLLRCDMGQGYYFSPAVPPAQFEHFIA